MVEEGEEQTYFSLCYAPENFCKEADLMSKKFDIGGVNYEK